MGKMELLAPAGGPEQLRAAVQSGADAVYLGASSFSARAGAGNFDYAQLREAVRYCHVYGVKVHCALNTLIKESEFEEAVRAAREIYLCGVDAIIIQDIGLAAYLHRLLPDIELHASTQMTVTSPEGVRYLEEHGFSRVVLARELSEAEIAEIAKDAKAELEVFVHGAICMCYSGQCLMSSMLGGRSGNRGRCAQPCRLQYDLLKNGGACESAYVLSPKDMALIAHLEALRKMGVASLKIEGRLKSAEYVSAVTGVYRKYLDTPAEVAAEDMAELKNAFSRSGFTDGYFTGTTGRHMMSHSNPANNSGSSYSAAAKERASGKLVRRIPIHVYASLAMGDVLRIIAYDDEGNCVSCNGTVAAEPAKNTALTAERLREQLVKTGSTPFSVADINIETDEGVTIPIKDINETRRRFCTELEEQRGRLQSRQIKETDIYYGKGGIDAAPYISAEVMNAEQGRAVIAAGGVRRIYAPAAAAAELLACAGDIEIVTKTADIFREENPATEYVSVSSPAAMRFYGARAAYGDFRLNVYNSHTINEFSSLKCVTLSPELNMREIADITAHADVETEIIAYGRIPLMLMRNCPAAAMGNCGHGRQIYSLRDRKNMEFPIVCTDRESIGCRNGSCKAVLLNSKPIFTADIMENIKKLKINCIRLNFTVEKSEQCVKIVSVYKNALEGKKTDALEENSFTRGHLRRGVL